MVKTKVKEFAIIDKMNVLVLLQEYFIFKSRHNKMFEDGLESTEFYMLNPKTLAQLQDLKRFRPHSKKNLFFLTENGEEIIKMVT